MLSAAILLGSERVTKINTINQVLQLCRACTVWSDAAIKLVSQIVILMAQLKTWTRIWNGCQDYHSKVKLIWRHSLKPGPEFGMDDTLPGNGTLMGKNLLPHREQSLFGKRAIPLWMKEMEIILVNLFHSIFKTMPHFNSCLLCFCGFLAVNCPVTLGVVAMICQIWAVRWLKMSCSIHTVLAFKTGNMNMKKLVGWLVLGLTALWDSISVYIGPSPKEREKEERKDRRE